MYVDILRNCQRFLKQLYYVIRASWLVLVTNNPPANAGNAGDLGSIPVSGRFPGKGHGHPPQYSCLENPMDRGAWWVMVHTVAKSWTQLKWLSTQSHHALSIAWWLRGKNLLMQEMQETWVQSRGLEDPLEEEMATHSSILARTEEPGMLQSMVLLRVRYHLVRLYHHHVLMSEVYKRSGFSTSFPIYCMVTIFNFSHSNSCVLEF